MTTTTMYTDDTDVEDGGAATTVPNSLWTVLVNHAGGNAINNAAAHIDLFRTTNGSITNRYQNISRSFFGFDTSDIGAGEAVSAATLVLTGREKNDHTGSSFTYNIVSADPASNTAIVAGDYDSVGDTKFSDTDISHSSASTSGTNSWAFNSAGIAYIKVDEPSFFAGRETTYDLADSSPGWTANGNDGGFNVHSAEQAGAADQRPTLTVTHAAAFTPRLAIFI
jgi:hypothetical protein